MANDHTYMCCWACNGLLADNAESFFEHTERCAGRPETSECVKFACDRDQFLLLKKLLQCDHMVLVDSEQENVVMYKHMYDKQSVFQTQI